jgi:hypothetical protein
VFFDGEFGKISRRTNARNIFTMKTPKNRDAQFVRAPTIEQHLDMSQKQVDVIHASVLEVPHTW